MDSGLKLYGVIASSAIVLGNGSPALVKFAARLAKAVFGDRIQICNGTDDHVEINAAVNALSANGGRVLLLGPTYNISSPINIMVNNLTLEGLEKSTKIYLSNGSDCHMIVVGNNATAIDGVEIRGIHLDGNSAGQGAGNWYGIHMDGAAGALITNAVIEACTFTNIDYYPAQIEYGQFIWFIKNKGNTLTQSVYFVSCSWGVVQENIWTGAGGSLAFMFRTNIASHFIVSQNVSDATTGAGGIIDGYGFDHGIISANVMNNATQEMAWLRNADWNVLIGNKVNTTAGRAFWVSDSNHNIVTGNEFYNVFVAIELDDADYNLVSNNAIVDTDDDGIIITDTSSYNYIVDNKLYDIDDYGIDIDDPLATYNRIGHNDILTGPSGPTLPIRDLGTKTILPSLLVPFSDGTDPQDSGYLIDADTEYARAWSRLPPYVQQVVKMKIYARSVVLEADRMRLNIEVKGGADNEAYNTHSTSAPDTPSTSSNFAADDVIYWALTAAGIVALLGGDSVEVKVLHEGAGDGDCATNAYIRSVEFEYV